ncbi:MAG: T9SS type A sorting domain-containing protein [candidate division WOR-3 bacterium]
MAEVSADQITLTASGVEEKSNSTRPGTVSVYPNPARGRTTVNCSLSEAGPSSWVLYDAAGRSVLGGVLKPGTSSFPLDLRTVPAGVYVLRLSGAVNRSTVINRLPE